MELIALGMFATIVLFLYMILSVLRNIEQGVISIVYITAKTFNIKD